MAETKKNKGGRPVTTDYEALINDADAFIEDCIVNEKLPQVNRYAREHGITRQYLYELAHRFSAEGDKRLSDSIKKIIENKEELIEERVMTGKYNPTMGIFSLKQLGWRDKPEIDENKEMLDKLDTVLDKLGGKL